MFGGSVTQFTKLSHNPELWKVRGVAEMRASWDIFVTPGIILYFCETLAKTSEKTNKPTDSRHRHLGKHSVCNRPFAFGLMDRFFCMLRSDTNISMGRLLLYTTI